MSGLMELQVDMWEMETWLVAFLIESGGGPVGVVAGEGFLTEVLRPGLSGPGGGGLVESMCECSEPVSAS